jgi:hypothetical protein
MRHARRDNKCFWCEEVILRFSPEVISRFRWRAGDKTFTKFRRFHPNCWVEQGLEYLRKNPPVVRMGRPRLALNQEDRGKRLKILRRRAQLMYLFRNASESGKVIQAVEYYLKAYELIKEIEPLGGAPKSWIEEVHEVHDRNQGGPVGGKG